MRQHPAREETPDITENKGSILPIGIAGICCPGHVAKDDEPMVCRYCGAHVDRDTPAEPGL